MIEIVLIAAIVLAIGLASGRTKQEPEQPRESTEMRCPSCGAPVRNYGDRWECTWCSDFGRIGKQ